MQAHHNCSSCQEARREPDSWIVLAIFVLFALVAVYVTVTILFA